VISIGKVRSADYYLGEVERDDAFGYYSDIERLGQWHGALATELGLTGEVDSADFRLVLEGVRPDTGERLTKLPTSTKALDVTLSVSKSISVMWALGSPEVSTAVEHAVDVAEEAVIRFLETDAARVRRGHGGVVSLVAEGLAVASFDHRTSRMGDPNLHRHLIVANAARGPDGRITALDTRLIYRIRYTAEAVFQAVLRKELAGSPGWLFDKIDRHGVGEVFGVDWGVMREFSSRRRVIEEEMEVLGVRGGRAARLVALDTRPAKTDDPAASTMRARWSQRAAEQGFRTSRVFAEPHVAELTRGDDAIAWTLTCDYATFSRWDAIRAVCRTADDGASLDMILERTERFLAGRDAIALGDDVYTTQYIINAETEATDIAVNGLDCGRCVVSEVSVRAALDTRPGLADEQRRLVELAALSGDAVTIVIGQAGAGKTTALDALRDAYQRDGFQVYGAALSARAAAELQSGAGIASHTIHRTLKSLDDRRVTLDAKTVMVIDEAAMVGTLKLSRLIRYVDEAGAKVVLVGDQRQLPEINAGGTFAAIARRIEPIRLRENRRQADPDQRAALSALRRLDADWALAHLQTSGNLTIGQNADSVRAALVADWNTARESGSHAIMIASTRADVADLNVRARSELRESGRIGQPIWANETVEFAKGDRVIATRNRHKLGLLNGQQATVAFATKDGLGIVLDNGELIVAPDEYINSGHLRHGYAITVHKAQGMTCDDTFFLGDEGLYNELAYTGMSRGRNSNRLYTVRPLDENGRPHPDPFSEIRHDLTSSRAKTAAIDHRRTVADPADVEIDDGISL